MRAKNQHGVPLRIAENVCRWRGTLSESELESRLLLESVTPRRLLRDAFEELLNGTECDRLRDLQDYVLQATADDVRELEGMPNVRVRPLNGEAVVQADIVDSINSRVQELQRQSENRFVYEWQNQEQWVGLTEDGILVIDDGQTQRYAEKHSHSEGLDAMRRAVQRLADVTDHEVEVLLQLKGGRRQAKELPGAKHGPVMLRACLCSLERAGFVDRCAEGFCLSQDGSALLDTLRLLRERDRIQSQRRGLER